MKRAILIAGLFAIALSCFSGCGLLLDQSPAPGSVTLSMDLNARTIQPADASIAITGYTVSGTGPGGAVLASTSQSLSSFTIGNLVPGSWTLDINGNNAAGTTIATGSVGVTIISGSTVSAEVALAPLSGEGIYGTFTLSASWTSPLVVTQVSGTITPVGGTAQPFSATLSGSTANYSISTLAAGSYIFLLNATESSGKTFRSIYALRIYKGLVSPLIIAFTAVNFNVTSDIETVPVEAGSFSMGSSSSGFANEAPVHTVSVSNFVIGKYEITQAQYSRVMGSNPSFFASGADAPNRPVEQINWYDAVSFCNALSIKDGLDAVYTISGTTVTADWTKNGWRLPTEAEWEFAARGGIHSNGYTFSGCNNAEDVAWHYGNASSTTHPVGSKLSNELGIFDMSGNVSEWVWDWYDLYSSGASVNPRGPSSGSRKILRGSAWSSGYYGGTVEECIHVSIRYAWVPADKDESFHSFGLRIARSGSGVRSL
jgi:formylglycine-generating enzyme required for sulfatase activity